MQSLSRPHDIRLLKTVARLRLLPESYIYGLADVRIMSDFYSSYLFGKDYPKGVWFYFPAAFAVKSSLSFLILLLIAVWAYAVAVLVLFQAISVTRTYPAYLAYANELWGGPSQTYKYLSDSNVDWAQQLKSTKHYLDKRGVKDCWFVYFAEGVVDARYYGIPCKPLPTADSLWVNEPAEAPPVIDGTVLISAGNLSGFEFGPGPLNPYEQFKQLRPGAVIDYGVFVFDGHFEIPLAAAISHNQKAGNLLEAKRLPEALSEAQQAVALAPNAVRTNATLGNVLVALGHSDEARLSYQKALALARTIEPEFQVGWVDGLEKKLAGK